MNRKSFLGQSAAVLSAALLPFPADATSPRKRGIRFAHLTDIHVKPGAIPEAGMAKALHHAQQLRPAVDFIINGGDSIMDALEADKPRVQTQWDLYKKILHQENSLPVYHAIGNHDIWGWFIKTNRPESDALYGKQWVRDELELPNRYYHFEKGKWSFIVLDSTQLNPAGGYIGRLDPEQWEWFQQQLKSIPASQHICIVSHIPLLSICAGLFFDKTEANGDLMIKRNLMHTDFLAIKKLLEQYPNVKVCLSGHIHLQDQLEYLGIRYYCNGAVCGNWWGGAFQEFEPAYAVVELFDDGTHSRQMITY